ncbi:MAG TPA: SulP family inorganic anion transporter, partial [Anaerolineaceae bacterium]
MKPSAGNEPARQENGESEAHVGASFPAGISRLKALPIPWERVAEGISSGLVVGLIEVLDVVSFGALIFSGRISSSVGQGIGLLLLGCTGTILVLSLLGSFSGSLPVVQDAPAAVLVVIAAGLMRSLPSAVSEREVFLTVAAAVAISALLTGLVFWLLGQFHLGALIRYLPYPVIGGFLAGTGWLLLTGGIGIMASVPISLTGLAALVQPAMLVRWLPGLLLGLGMLAVLNRF